MASRTSFGEFKIGDTVEVKICRRRAKIRCWFKDTPGGVELDRRINGFKLWNVDDLKLIRRGGAG